MTESESLIFSELMTFVSLIKKSLCLDFSDHLVHIIKETQHQFQTATPSEKTTYMITKFLRDLVTVLKRQEQSETASKLPLKSFFKSILTKFFFRTAPSFPEEQFKVSNLSKQDTDTAPIGELHSESKCGLVMARS